MTRILVIEDETTLREDITMMLELEGFEGISAEDGLMGLQTAREHQPDLIICDVMMPNLDGHEVLRAVRDDATIKNTPFIFLTARADRVDMRMGMGIGADDYLTKPFTKDELLNAVISRLRRQEDLKSGQDLQLKQAQQRLTQMVAHELRTPLVSITMVQDLITRRLGLLSTTQMEDLLTTLAAGTRRMAHLVEQMVLITQIEAGALSENSIAQDGTAIQLWELLTTTADVARRFAIRDAEITLVLDERDSDVSVFCDVAPLKHALAELIANAINFSPAGTEVTVSQWQADDRVWINILDSGPGIAREHIDRAWQAFQQIEREKQEQQGVGMGLPLAYQIINMHGGVIELNSVVGKGTQVVIELPMMKA